jgi:ATP-dependent exoDNAse (exonuclease V) alpha subunit
VYERAERVFAEGERVQLTAPWKSKGIVNRQTGTLERVAENGEAVLRMDKDERRVRLNLSKMQHLDYGYAIRAFLPRARRLRRS